jgi:HAAS
MIGAALTALDRELRGAGVALRDRRRVCAEARAHLEDSTAAGGEAEAVAAFGDPGTVARAVAAELAVSSTRRAALAAFAGLSLVGVAYVGLNLLEGLAGAPPDIASGREPLLGVALTAGVALLPQVAFVAGGLALVHAWRIRGQLAGGADLAVLRRRALVGVAAGAATMVALGLRAFEFAPELAGWWAPTTVAACLASLAAIAPAWWLLRRSARPRARDNGRASDVFDDLAPILRLPVVARAHLPVHPWRFAGVCAAGVWAMGFVGGVAGEGAGDGLFFGTVEAAALLLSFALLGRALGLRRAA